MASFGSNLQHLKDAHNKAKEADADGGPKSGVDDLGRHTWDKDYFKEKAEESSLFGGLDAPRPGKKKKEFIPLPASQRQYLQGRKEDPNLEKDLGKFRVVTCHTIKPLQGGYWCSVCECLIKDSACYLDHINGRRHNRNLGMNMKVENIGLDTVKERLAALSETTEKVVEAEDIEARIAALEQLEEEKKARKKEKRKRKKQQAAAAPAEEDEDDDEEGAGGGGEPKKQKTEGGDGEEEEEGTGGGEEEEDEETKMMRAMGLPVVLNSSKR